jgi:hypothetical protein
MLVGFCQKIMQPCPAPSVKLRRTEGGFYLALTGRFDPSTVDHAAAKGWLVEGGAGDCLMHALQVPQGEGIGQQEKAIGL